MSINNQKPCLVQTGQGFSVKYNERLLYSRYNPAKNILLSIQGKEFLAGTLVLAISPCLGYGIKELLEKLGPDCYVLGIEKDANLIEFTLQQEEIKECLKDPRFSFLNDFEIEELPLCVNQGKVTSSGYKKMHFKRCIRIDFSGAASFNDAFYEQIFECTSQAIAQFWKNRITLVKFGKKYCKNLFKNLRYSNSDRNLLQLYKTQTKSILVLGAGEGLDQVLDAFKNGKAKSENFYIIAVDAALACLSKCNIKADLVVLEESQWIIKRLFIGNSIKANKAAVSLSSSFAAVKNVTEDVFFYTTLFSNAEFLGVLSDMLLLPASIPPLGSVGLTAVEIALRLRQNEGISVYVAGLDFSYSLGRTHSRYAKQSETPFLLGNRLTGSENCGSAFAFGCTKTLSKDKNIVYTSTNLSGYAQLFRKYFFNTANLFDCSTTGLPLNLPYKPLSERDEGVFNSAESSTENFILKPQNTDELTKKKIDFFKNELTELEKIQEILTTGQNMDETERNNMLRQLLSKRDYLYHHFPDGYELRIEADFLKRVKAEIICFKKLFSQLIEN